MIPIDKMSVAAAPPDFEFARTGQGTVGQWIVVEDSTAAAGRAIEQTSAERTDFRFPLAVYQPSSEWHTLALRAENDRCAVTFDGKTMHATVDRSFEAAGRRALDQGRQRDAIRSDQHQGSALTREAGYVETSCRGSVGQRRRALCRPECTLNEKRKENDDRTPDHGGSDESH